ncbi:MAG: Dihydroorotase family cyclic amidohydrolase, AllB [Candidatus Methanohalarchaeum thermophilum]|uniref:Dihydroorotase n=1 Tax=Methanohalarchaeum thermophilum TaxID=1903181 RepID=A0A1Q6DS55_METT1|nr:MAG: Dihydroorotase family cyclic amidohydrolase, AllB [Candidatus Methanohalarchaeum thermophilum]
MKVVKNGRILYKNNLIEADIGIERGKITEIKKTGLNGEIIDAGNKIVLPGFIDSHVHFRDFKQKQKETWRTGSKAAAAGGITTVVEQPNTDPPTLSRKAIRRKSKLASRRSFVDFGLNAGVVSGTDISELNKEDPTAFGEIFLAHDELGIDLNELKGKVDEINKLDKKPTLHAEDQRIVDIGLKKFRDRSPGYFSRARPAKAEIKSIKELKKTLDKNSVHICHVSTAKAAKIVANTKNWTYEVTPHHLFFTKSDLEEKRSYIKTNPPVRNKRNRKRLWYYLKNESVDIIASDHAPHTVGEKEGDFWDTPSGVPGVQTTLPLLAYQVKRKNISINTLSKLMARNPSEIFNMKNKGQIKEGNDADLVIMDFNEIKKINRSDLYSKCGWSPYEGKEAIFPEKTILRGDVVYDKGGFEERKGERI